MRAFCASSNLRRAARLVTRHYDRALRPIGVTAAQLPILAAISTGAANSIASMSKVLDIEASSLSRDLSLLQKKGLVRLTTATDRRSRALQLTPRGQRTLVSAFDAWRKAHDKLLAVVGERDFQSMLKQTRNVGRAVKTIRKER
ncbi:MAG: MarR family winged helix-turn-helix transcriptional regulator [Thermoanaerobaculia bacterium]